MLAAMACIDIALRMFATVEIATNWPIYNGCGALDPIHDDPIVTMFAQNLDAIVPHQHDGALGPNFDGLTHCASWACTRCLVGHARACAGVLTFAPS